MKSPLVIDVIFIGITINVAINVIMKKMKKCDITVIGGGPAGMFAGIIAGKSAKTPLDILIIERNLSLGRKLLRTGNGKCNITNKNVSPDNYHGGNKKFISNVLSQFSNKDLLDYFGKLGVDFIEENGKYFPATNQAGTILDVLKDELKKYRIETSLNTKVNSVSKNGNKEFVIDCSGDRQITCDKLILATGGLAHPQLGSEGDGYYIAKQFGHTLVPALPALVALETKDKSIGDMGGVKTFAEVTAIQNNKLVANAKDEILFTEYGVSGPAVLHISSFIARNLKTQKTELKINFFPDRSKLELEKRIYEIWRNNPEKTLIDSLSGMLPKKILNILIDGLKLNINMPCSKVSPATKDRILQTMLSFPIQISGCRPYEDAQVTSGGVCVDEIDNTMESKLVKNLFFAGEIIDVNGDCGGYNLQFAFSTGYIAGVNIIG